MPAYTIGDLRHHFQTAQTGKRLKGDLNELVQELTTGKKQDLTAHLGAQQSNLASLDRRLTLYDRYIEANTQTSRTLDAMQVALTAVEDQRATSSDALLVITAASTPQQLERAAQTALHSFERVTNSLNTRLGDKTLFGGNTVDQAPLSDPDTMLSDLKGALSGLTTAGAISAAIDTWFDAPGGGFETIGYQGDTSGYQTRPTDLGQDISLTMRADDQATRDVLKALAKGALAADTTLGLPQDVAQHLQQQAGLDLLGSAAGLATAQARLGHVEGEVSGALTHIQAQKTAFGMSRNEMVLADPFETATRLEALQVQLETHYTLTARLSRLSLTEYLR